MAKARSSANSRFGQSPKYLQLILYIRLWLDISRNGCESLPKGRCDNGRLAGRWDICRLTTYFTPICLFKKFHIFSSDVSRDDVIWDL
ncbi:hypothetical protein TNCT_36431 [Trichonephila clavata]|uniref:Uncharacterized protein n=1 Tax=Trichonephila clavata TaxID=2740835 RepID=A0A8X6KYU6_TRICU|nr:hypothetical protein TNCT_36431 [Trichonephila clavata]